MIETSVSPRYAREYLNDLLPGVLGQLQRQQQAKSLREDPVKWAEYMLGIQLWSKQREIAYSVRDNRNTAVAAGHGVGKSFVAAVIACWWIDTHPWRESETFVASTAPTKDQVDLIWGNIRSMLALTKERYQRGLIDHPLPGYITGDNKWKLDNGQTLGQGRKPPDSKTDVAFQGRHATYLLAIGDEAVGLNKELLDALGNITTGANNRLLLLTNPTDPGCAMAKLWPNKEGKGGNSSWTRIHISVFDSPLITKEPGFDLKRAEGLSGEEFIQEKREDWGEDDPRFIARVRGEWAWDSGDTLFNEETIAKACRTVVVPDMEQPDISLGVDVAWDGPDDTVVYSAVRGEVYETDDAGKPVTPTGVTGYKVRFVRKWKAPLTSNDPQNPGTAERVDMLARELGASAVNVDASGMGAGVLDGLANFEDAPYDVYQVWGSSNREVDPRAHLNLRAKQFDDLRRMMFKGQIDIDVADVELLDQLRGVRYEWMPNGAMKIESKADMKRRSAKSPDRADAVWYSMVGVVSEGGVLQPGDRVVADVEDFSEINGWYARDGINAFGW